MKFEIKHRFNGSVLFSGEFSSLKLCVEAAVSQGADLRGANLQEADLRGANLREADLREVYLREADLLEVYLRGANLRGADLNWRSHVLLAEILRRAAKDDAEKRKLAGLVLVSPDWCWKKFLALDDPLKGWALDELAKWAKDGDEAPEEIKARRRKEPPMPESPERAALRELVERGTQFITSLKEDNPSVNIATAVMMNLYHDALALARALLAALDAEEEGQP